MDKKMIIYIAIMALVTYIPRVMPLILMKGREIKSDFLKDFLFYVPYTVLGSMTFPAIIYSTGNVRTAIIGTGVALFLSYYNKGLVKVAMYSTIVVYLVSFLFN